MNEMKANSKWVSNMDRHKELTHQGYYESSKEIKDIIKSQFSLGESIKALKRTIDAIEISNQQSPLTVLGVQADYTILLSIGTAIATLGAAIISAIISD